MMTQTNSAGATGFQTGDTTFIKKELNAIHSILGIPEESGGLVNLLQEMSRMVLIDELTGLANRFYFDRRLPAEVRNAVRKNEPLSLVTLEIDRLKEINEKLGFTTGDEMIRQIASLMTTRVQSAQGLMRQRYLYARYCGGQFYILLPGTMLQPALTGATRLRQKIEQHPFQYQGEKLSLTASFGVAEWNSELKLPQELVEQANYALALSRQKGSNHCTALPEK